MTSVNLLFMYVKLTSVYLFSNYPLGLAGVMQCVRVNFKMSQQASSGVANMLKVHATLSRKKHAQEINACLGRPLLKEQVYIRYSRQAIRTRSEKRHGLMDIL